MFFLPSPRLKLAADEAAPVPADGATAGTAVSRLRWHRRLAVWFLRAFAAERSGADSAAIGCAAGRCASRPARPRRPLRILCAEDNIIMAEVIAKALGQAGHRVECCFDGLAAWGRLEEQLSHFDALITDHEMPKLTGLELSQRAREAGYGGIIILQSSQVTRDLEQACRELRVNYVVPKAPMAHFVPRLLDKLS